MLKVMAYWCLGGSRRVDSVTTLTKSCMPSATLSTSTGLLLRNLIYVPILLL